jgi:Mg-chelatase subunit ChlI
MFDNFWGNPHVTQALEQMVAQDRLAQTLLFAGPEGVGKATLARRLGARLLPRPAAIEQRRFEPFRGQPGCRGRARKAGRPTSAIKIRCCSPRAIRIS